MGSKGILLVEDEAITAKDIQECLIHLGYEVIGNASSGEEAVEKALRLSPDLVLRDVQLKGRMDGIEAAQQIREDLRIPVLYVTAHADEETLRRAKMTEPYGYILKPIEERELHFSIEIALYKHRIESRLKEREKWLDAILQNIGDGIITTDVSGCISFLNPVAAGLTGWKPEEAVGRPLRMVLDIAEEKPGEATEKNPTALEGGTVHRFANHKLLKTKTGEEIIIEENNSPILDEKRKVLGNILVFRDIEERMRENEALRRSQEKSQRLAQETAIIAKMGRVISSTPNIEEIYDRFAAEAKKLIPFDRLAISVYHPQEGNATVAYVSGMGCEERRVGDTFPLARSVNEEVMRRRSGVLIQPEAREDRELEARFPILVATFREGLRSMMSVPLISGDVVIGALHFRSRRRKAYTDQDLRLAESIAHQIAGAIANAQLFRERKRAEAALRESEERYRIVVENASHAGEGILLIQDTAEVENAFVFANKEVERLTGYTQEELRHKSWVDIVHPRHREASIDRVRRKMNREDIPGLYEVSIVTKDGVEVPIEITGGYAQFQGKHALVGFCRDIAERQRADDQLKASLREKEILLAEIHHRVKNNMQIISSLLKLQSRYLKNEKLNLVLQDCQNRIRTMALIHEKLYQLQNFARIDFVGYIRDLAKTLFRSYGVDPARIVLEIRGEKVFWGMTTAIPCGLLLHELISNSLKHAFPGRRRGEIYLGVHTQEGQVTLTIKDNGVGFPRDLDWRKSESLGLQLVLTLTEQLEGTVQLHGEGGTEFQIIFPEEKLRRAADHD